MSQESRAEAGAAPIAVTSAGGAAAHAFAWRHKRVLSVCVVVKIARNLSADGLLSACPAEAPAQRDRHYHEDAKKPLRLPTDLVPFRDEVDLFFCGRAPLGTTSARLGLLRAGAPLVDKSVAVAGNADGAGLAPMAAGDAARQALLHGAPAPGMVDGILTLGADLDRRYFQCTPADQRTPEVRPGDQLVLQGLHPQRERVVCTLPNEAPVAVAKLGQASHTVGLRCDQIHFDAGRSRCVFTWRGSFTVPDEESLTRLQVDVSVGAAAPAPAVVPVAPREVAIAMRPAPAAAPDATMALDESAPAASTEPAWLPPVRGAGLPAALLRKMQKGRPAAAPGVAPAPGAPPVGQGPAGAFFVPHAAASAGATPFGAGAAPGITSTLAIENEPAPRAAATPFAPHPSARRTPAGPAVLPGAPWSQARSVTMPQAESFDSTMALDGDAPPPPPASVAAEVPPARGSERGESAPEAPSERATEVGGAARPGIADTGERERAAEPRGKEPPPARPSDPWGQAAPSVSIEEAKPPPRVRPDVKSALRKKFGR